MRPFIDWTPFFIAWEIKGKFPRLFDDPAVGAEARKLHTDANALLDRWERSREVTINAALGLWPANAIGDDIALYSDDARTDEMARLHTLRQQTRKAAGKPNRALADYVAPTGVDDWIGAFVVGVMAPTPSPLKAEKLRTTTTPRSSPKPSPTVWPRRLPSGSTPASAATIGATHTTKCSITTV